MTKLKDDPAVAALLEKHGLNLAAQHNKRLNAHIKETIRAIKSESAQRASDAKLAGNKDAARYLMTLGNDLAERLKAGMVA